MIIKYVCFLCGYFVFFFFLIACGIGNTPLRIEGELYFLILFGLIESLFVCITPKKFFSLFLYLVNTYLSFVATTAFIYLKNNIPFDRNILIYDLRFFLLMVLIPLGNTLCGLLSIKLFMQKRKKNK